MDKKLPLFTDPSNHAKAEAAVKYFYKTAGLKEPLEFMWVESPYKCLKFYKMCKEADVEDLGDPVKDKLNSVLSQFAFLNKHWKKKNNFAAFARQDEILPVLNQVKERLKEELKLETIYHSLYGIFSHTAPKLLPLYNRLKTEEDREMLDILINLFSETAWIIPYENVCVLSEKPVKFHINNSLEFHHEEEKSLEFKDGFGLYSIGGVTVPDFVFEQPEKITASAIKKMQNLEIRRIMIDRMGISKYLDAVHAKVLDMDSIYVFKDGDERTMPRALMVDDEGNKYLVGTDGSTERVYYMRVPPDSRTCRHAHSLIAGFDENRIIANS
jgi:hypothetical protein